MIFYHGTSEENWDLIQKEGILFGVGSSWTKEDTRYRYTYLSPHIEVAEKYGDVLLEIEYEPVGAGVKAKGEAVDNYGFDPPEGMTCWQFSVFIPIPISKIKRILRGKNV